MMWFFAILVVLALGGVAVVAAGRGQPMGPAYDDAPDSLVPADGPVTAEDLRRIRFPLAVRGYRMAEVDALLERLAEEREATDRAAPDRETGGETGPPPGSPETEGDTDPSASAH
jgi:DivIVA domain-containing protein